MCINAATPEFPPNGIRIYSDHDFSRVAANRQAMRLLIIRQKFRSAKMIIKTPTIRNGAAVVIASLITTGCDSEVAEKPSMKTVSAKSSTLQPVPKTDGKNLVKDQVVLGGKSYELTFVLCQGKSPHTGILASTVDELEMMRIRFKRAENPGLSKDFLFQIDDNDKGTRILWQSSDIDIKKTGDKVYDISGTVAGTGMRLDDKIYKNDPALKPANRLQFRATFTCT